MACQAQIKGVCELRADHGHHRKLRRFGDHSPPNMLDVCAPCHDFIHHNPTWAYTWGLMLRSWDEPTEVHPHPFADPNITGPIPVVVIDPE